MRRISKQDRRLALKRETLRVLGQRLSELDLARVAGGGTEDCTDVDSALMCDQTGQSLTGSRKCIWGG